ncbi:MAG: hypothetical protein ACJASX_001643 [Limisphaerales bacterium]|jgi:hypothetical protein
MMPRGLAARSAALFRAVNSGSAAKPVNTSFFGNKAIDGYDTVAYHTQKQAVKGSKQYSQEWQVDKVGMIKRGDYNFPKLIK